MTGVRHWASVVNGERSREAADLKNVAPPCCEPEPSQCSCEDESARLPSPQVCCQPHAKARPYDCGPSPWIIGQIASDVGPIPRVATKLTSADRLGTWRVRWNIRRMHYRVSPGLYAVGVPTAASPVLVTANYKLTFDSLRSELSDVDAWILVLDTRGVNVWCAAGKGTFSTDELARQVNDTGLDRIVDHRRLILPQLGASGVAGHLARKACGFSVVYGPVRAADIPAFLSGGLKATPEMRAVQFSLRDRVVLIPVEASIAWRWQTLVAVVVVAFLVGFAGSDALSLADYGRRLGLLYGLLLVPIVGGSVIVLAALPFIPGRAFSTKGALVGGVLAALTLCVLRDTIPMLALLGIFFGATAACSYAALNFTGSTPFTSPSGVEREMPRALPLQLAGGLIAVFLFVAQLVLQLLGVRAI